MLRTGMSATAQMEVKQFCITEAADLGNSSFLVQVVYGSKRLSGILLPQERSSSLFLSFFSLNYRARGISPQETSNSLRPLASETPSSSRLVIRPAQQSQHEQHKFKDQMTQIIAPAPFGPAKATAGPEGFQEGMREILQTVTNKGQTVCHILMAKYAISWTCCVHLHSQHIDIF